MSSIRVIKDYKGLLGKAGKLGKPGKSSLRAGQENYCIFCFGGGFFPHL